MGNIIENFDTDVNFWQVNPELKLPKIFADLYSNDKSKGKSWSSKIMWGLAMLVDSKSKFHFLSEEDRRKIIADDWIEDSKFKWDDYIEHIKVFTRLTQTRLSRSLLDLGKKIEERDELVKETRYTINNAKELDGVLSNTKSIYELYIYLTNEIRKEEDTVNVEGVVKGGRTESAGEKGLV